MRIYSKRAGENRLFHFARSEIAPYRTLFDMAYVLCEFGDTKQYRKSGKESVQRKVGGGKHVRHMGDGYTKTSF